MDKKPFHTLSIKDFYTGEVGTVALYDRGSESEEYDYVASFGPNHESSHSGVVTIPHSFTMEEVVKLLTEKVNK